MMTVKGPDRPCTPALLLDLATACRRGERVQLTYRDRAGTTSTRRVDTYRLIYTGRRWYLLAYDLTRQDWRTFRADRIIDATATGQATALPDPPDPAQMVSTGIALRPFSVRVTIRLAVPADEAHRLVPPTVGVHHPDGDDATIIDIGGPDADGLARYLLSLGRNFYDLLDRYDVGELYPVYSRLSSLAHTTMATADAYVGHMDDGTLQIRQKAAKLGDADAIQLTVALLQAAVAVSPLLEGDPLRPSIDQALADLGLENTQVLPVRVT